MFIKIKHLLAIELVTFRDLLSNQQIEQLQVTVARVRVVVVRVEAPVARDAVVIAQH